MPPVGRDDTTHAMHVLNVLECAKALVAAISRAGLQKAMNNAPEINEELRVLFDETSKLQVYEARARARGTLSALDTEQMAEAISGVRKQRTLTISEADSLVATPTQIAESFSLEGPDPIQAMQDEVKKTFEALGAPIEFDADADLQKLGKGAPLRMGELRALPNGAPVFVTYKEHGERSFRIKGAMRINREPGKDEWVLSDGSSFVAEFCSTDADSEVCSHEPAGEGEMLLFHVTGATAPAAKTEDAFSL